MGKEILDDAYVEVDGVVISNYVDTVEIDYTWEDNDVTGMGSAAREHLLGLNDPNIKLTIFQSFDAGSVDAVFNTVAGKNTPFPVIIRPRASAGVGPTNPQFEMQCLCPTYSPLKGQVGKPSMTDITLVNGSQTGIVRTET